MRKPLKATTYHRSSTMMTASQQPRVPTPDVLSSPEHVLSTLEADGSRRWLYPTPSKGVFQKARRLVGWALIGLFVALPIVQIGGRPAVFLDVVHREFTLLGTTFFPTDTLLLLLLGISGVLFVILITALLGRSWCGWACPQTVYLEFLYRPIERLIEGKEHVRSRRDNGPWTFDKIWRKGLKLSVFLTISFVLAHVFVAYFAGWEFLLDWMTQPPTEHPGFFALMAGTTGLIFFDFGYFREQMCTITCPYARMQSVLFDPDSLIIAYDTKRGEPRGKGSRKKQKEAGAGDCVDCFACVRTCPTGIDIRDGLQMECIACAQCIDACDVIMEKLNRPKGLIRYSSERAILDQKPAKLLRPRTVVYSVLFLAVAAAFVSMVALRAPFNINRYKGYC